MAEGRDQQDDRQNATDDAATRSDPPLQERHSVLAGSGNQREAISPVRWLVVLVPIIALIGGVALLANALIEKPLQIAIGWPWESSDAPSEPDKPLASSRVDEPEPVPTEEREVPPPSQRPPLDPADVLANLPRADLKNGAAVFKICTICHAAERNGPHRLGSNLWDILGRPKASYSDYAYSQALRSWGGRWTYEDMARFLYDTRSTLPGGKMAFAGIKNPAALADVIAYMRTLSDKPVPLPTAK